MAVWPSPGQEGPGWGRGVGAPGPKGSSDDRHTGQSVRVGHKHSGSHFSPSQHKGRAGQEDPKGPATGKGTGSSGPTGTQGKLLCPQAGVLMTSRSGALARPTCRAAPSLWQGRFPACADHTVQGCFQGARVGAHPAQHQPGRSGGFHSRPLGAPRSNSQNNPPAPAEALTPVTPESSEGKTPRRRDPGERGLREEAHHHRLHSRGPLQNPPPAPHLGKGPAETLGGEGEYVGGPLSIPPKGGCGADVSPDPASLAGLWAPDGPACLVLCMLGPPGGWAQSRCC